MLKIKLARFGKKNQPHFRIVINEARDKRDGSYVDNIGHYAPTQTPKLLEIDVKAYQEWIAKGAQPTPTVARLFEKFNSPEPFPAKKAKPSKKSQEKAKAEAKDKAEAKEAAKTEATKPEAEAAPEATEAPAAEETPAAAATPESESTDNQSASKE